MHKHFPKMMLNIPVYKNQTYNYQSAWYTRVPFAVVLCFCALTPVKKKIHTSQKRARQTHVSEVSTMTLQHLSQQISVIFHKPPSVSKCSVCDLLADMPAMHSLAWVLLCHGQILSDSANRFHKCHKCLDCTGCPRNRHLPTGFVYIYKVSF